TAMHHLRSIAMHYALLSVKRVAENPKVLPLLQRNRIADIRSLPAIHNAGLQRKTRCAVGIRSCRPRAAAEQCREEHCCQPRRNFVTKPHHSYGHQSSRKQAFRNSVTQRNKTYFRLFFHLSIIRKVQTRAVLRKSSTKFGA